jgi:hypothetical protein
MLTEIEIIEQINKLYNDVDFSLVISFNSPSTMRKDMKGSGSLKLKVSGATGNINGTILKIEFKPYTGFVYSSFGGMISSSKSVEVENIILSYTEVYLESIPMKDILNKTDYKAELNRILVAKLDNTIKQLLKNQKFVDKKYSSNSISGAIFDIKDLKIL